MMSYTITYMYQGDENTVLLQDMQNMLGAIGQFHEDHVRECEIIKVELYS